MNITPSNFRNVLTTFAKLEENDFQIRDFAVLPDEAQHPVKTEKLRPIFSSFLKSMEQYYASIDQEGSQKYMGVLKNLIKETGDCNSAEENSSVDPWLHPVLMNKEVEQDLSLSGHYIEPTARKAEDLFNQAMQFLRSPAPSDRKFRPICRELMTTVREFWESTTFVRMEQETEK